MTRRLIIFLVATFTIGWSIQIARATTIISPLLELEADAGSVQPGVVKVYNETDSPLNLVGSVEAFHATGETGQPQFGQLVQDAEYIRWFSLTKKTLTLEPKQVALVPFTITIPRTARPGGYYAAIFWQTVSAQGAQVGVASKVGTLVFLTVHGTLVQKATLVEFSRQPAGLIWRWPVVFVSRLHNDGNIHGAPTGSITIRRWIGAPTKIVFNPDGGLILPGSTRRFDLVWGPPGVHGWFDHFFEQAVWEIRAGSWGRLTATTDIHFGETQMSDQGTIAFWALPTHALSVIGLIVIIFWLWRLRRRHQPVAPLSS